MASDDAPEASPTPFEDAVRDAQTSTTLKKQLEELVAKANGLLEQSTKSSVETALEIYDSCLRTQPQGDVVVPLLLAPATVPFEKHVRRSLRRLRFSTYSRKTACREKDLGNGRLKKGDLAGAVGHYTRAIAQDPDDAVLWSNRSAALLALDRRPGDGPTPSPLAARAAADAFAAIAADPSWPKGYLRLGHAMAAMGSALEAMEAFLNGAQVARVAARGGASSDCAALERAALACRERGNAQGRTLQSGAIARGLDVDEDRLHFERGAEDGGNGSVAGRHGLASCLLFKAWPTAALLGRPPRDVSVAGNKAAFDALARGWGVEAVDDRRWGAGGRGLRATRAFSEGATLFSETPLVAVSLRDDLCGYCCGPCRPADGGPVTSLSQFCCPACERDAAARVETPAVLERLKFARYELQAEGGVAAASFHVLALAQLTHRPEDRDALDLLCRPTDLPLDDLAARDLTVPFADRHAMCGELDRLLHGDDDDERLDAAPDADYVARRRGAAAVDLGDVDDRVGALTMNAFVFGPTGEAVCVPRLGALCNHAHDGNAELRPGPRRGEIAFVATRDIARGEAITLDYCPFSATTAHRDAVLRPFLLEHLARVPVVEDAPVAYPDEVAPLRRREPDFAPHP
ncbi:hypothetical protein JL722_9010 [Aureococcus anophagefferens]|nr:hypothetical protein JL722_9010 [Aureococcus anophagefferens]